MKYKKCLPGLFTSIILLFSLGTCNKIQAQEEGHTLSDFPQLTTDDYNNLELPALEVLFENAKSNPTFKMAEIQVLLQKKTLGKEKRSLINFLTLNAGYNFGKFGMESSYTASDTPIMYNYSSQAQGTYRVGVGITIPLLDAIEYGPKIKRQKLNIKLSEYEREQAFESLKFQIIELYTQIKSQLATLKLQAETLILANTQYAITEKDFINGRIESKELAEGKFKQSTIASGYEKIKADLNRNLIVLEMISHTTIIK